MKLTQLLQHLVALVEDEMFQVLQVELLVADESENATGCSNHDMRCCCLQSFFVLLDRHATEEHSNFNARHVLAEPFVLLADLEGQLASVAHDQNVDLIVCRLQLLKGGQHEDGCFSHTRLCLAQNVHAEDGLRNAFVLD